MKIYCATYSSGKTHNKKQAHFSEVLREVAEKVYLQQFTHLDQVISYLHQAAAPYADSKMKGYLYSRQHQSRSVGVDCCTLMIWSATGDSSLTSLSIILAAGERFPKDFKDVWIGYNNGR